MAESGSSELDGAVALVTGASSGLGRATAIALAQAGADVALIARSSSELENTAAAVRATGQRALVQSIDLARDDQIVSAVEQVVRAFNRLDILANCAGTDVPGAVVDITVADWDRVLAVNLRAPFVLARAAFPHMRRAGRGTIVNVSSVAGKRGWANAAPYCASKFALTGFTQALAAEGRPHGIRACLIYPGGMATSWGTWSPEERHANAGEAPPAVRALPPAEVGALIVWIASRPPEVVLNEVIVTPLEEQGWP
jgi:NAD(P)-dependent dehydrogenase (short-subunit alcohol dehydrogenase family)